MPADRTLSGLCPMSSVRPSRATSIAFATGVGAAMQRGRQEPLEIRLNGKPLTVTMRTPGHDLDLAAGFLPESRASEPSVSDRVILEKHLYGVPDAVPALRFLFGLTEHHRGHQLSSNHQIKKIVRRQNGVDLRIHGASYSYAESFASGT